MKPLVLTPAEVAEVLGLHVNQVYTLLRVGVLAGRRTSEGVQAHWMIPRQALDDYLNVRRARTVERAEDV